MAFMQEKKIQFYDSMCVDGMEYLPIILQYILDEHLDKKKCPLPDRDQWQLIDCTHDTPKQTNGTSASHENREWCCHCYYV